MPRGVKDLDGKIAKLDSIIAYHTDAIKKAEEKKEALLNPSKKMSAKELLSAIKEIGLTPEEALKKLKK